MTSDENLSLSNDYKKYEKFDWRDFDKVEKLNQKRSHQWLKIYAKIHFTDKENDIETIEKAKEDLKKHEVLDSFLKKKAAAAGYYWV